MLIHIEPLILLKRSKQIDSCLVDMHEATACLAKTLQVLDIHWQSKDSDFYQEEFAVLLRQVGYCVNDLNNLNALLRKHAEAWLELDHGGVYHFRSTDAPLFD